MARSICGTVPAMRNSGGPFGRRRDHDRRKGDHGLGKHGGRLVVDRRRDLGSSRGQIGHGPTVSSACGVAQGSLRFGPSAWQESEDSK